MLGTPYSEKNKPDKNLYHKTSYQNWDLKYSIWVCTIVTEACQIDSNNNKVDVTQLINKYEIWQLSLII